MLFITPESMFTLDSLFDMYFSYCHRTSGWPQRRTNSRTHLDILDVFLVFPRYLLFLPVCYIGWKFFDTGAVDSIIYATTRKMIKPINLPFHMVSLSNHGSGSNGQRVLEESISLEKRTSHLKRSSHSVKMTWPGDDVDDSDDIRKDSFEVAQHSPSARLGGIQITLERIQEVM